jgi:hypothetical protein
VELSYHNSRHAPVCVTPFKAMYSHGPLIPMDLELKKFEVEDPSLNGNAAKDVDELNGCKINMKRHKQGQNWMRIALHFKVFPDW